MKYTLPVFALLFPVLCLAQAPAPLPSNSATLVRQFEGFEAKTIQDAERSVDAARVKLISLLVEEANKASPNDALAIRAYLETIKLQAREAATPSSLEYWNTTRTVAGYYNNNPTMVVKVDTAGKKRNLIIHGNQATASTIGEVFLVRGENESKVGEWRKGQAGPLVFDVKGFVTKPGEYTFRLRYKDGGDEFVCDKLGIQVTK